MNARLALVCALLSLAGCAPLQPPTAAQKEDAINAALTSAYVACKVALADEASVWTDGAKEYCEFIVGQRTCKAP